MESDQFSAQTLAWYASHARQPPWRNSRDPYAIWVAVIMLQQTRLETVIPYFDRWMQRFPNLAVLALASMQEVLSTWEGLGYYGRARNLHKAARMVMQDYQGKLPEDVGSLCKLPGIGHYAAGAIASIAFGRDEPTLDGNMRRVLARYFNVAEDARSTHGEQILWKMASKHLPVGQAGLYNQALMDLGAIICTPKLPACDQCPLARTCEAKALGIQEQRPVAQPKPAIPHYTVTAAIIRRNKLLLITRRPSKGLLGGLWEFPGGKLKEGEGLPACLQREILEELGAEIRVGAAHAIYRHAYTHYRVTLHAFQCELVSGEPHAIEVEELAWVKPEELIHYPMGKIDRQISQSLISSESL